jgi:hypothetical protein
MYIPEFWCGVGSTLLVELIAFIAWAILRKND